MKAYGGADVQLHLFLISAVDEVEWLVNFTSRSLCPWAKTSVPTEQEAGWAPETVWMFCS